MEKLNNFTVFLMATSMIMSSLFAVEEQRRESKSLLQKAKKQFNESLDRFKRCMRGKCTKSEYAKGARDVAITAAVVITTMFGLKSITAGTAASETTVKKELPRGTVVWAYITQNPSMPVIGAVEGYSRDDQGNLLILVKETQPGGTSVKIWEAPLDKIVKWKPITSL